MITAEINVNTFQEAKPNLSQVMPEILKEVALTQLDDWAFEDYILFVKGTDMFSTVPSAEYKKPR